MAERIDLKVLAAFLNAANKSTYANANAPKTASLRPGSYDYHFEKDGLVYHDTYFGGRDFIGEEVVYKDGVAVWGMNYCGFLLKPEVATDVYERILRAALMQEYDDILPVRGPREYNDGDSTYRSSVEGTLGRFSGAEEILLNSEVVYRCWYHGGFVS